MKKASSIFKMDQQYTEGVQPDIEFQARIEEGPNTDLSNYLDSSEGKSSLSL